MQLTSVSLRFGAIACELTRAEAAEPKAPVGYSQQHKAAVIKLCNL